MAQQVGITNLRPSSLRDLLKEVMCQTGNLNGLRETMPSYMANATPRGNWAKRNFVREMTNQREEVLLTEDFPLLRMVLKTESVNSNW
jgi:hypothetical protein